ncbi:OsmC family protein [Undibacterium sp. SXout7W]|uniref:OsmC family protein n=1 Tax=Undibacterium sp. SXout7W TaxID=3413049 RepID=UPI003BF40CFC
MSGTASITAILKDVPYQVELKDDLGHTWMADEPLDMGGGNVGTSPDRLMMASLASCTAITIKMVAARRQWPLTSIQVEAQLNPAGKPETGNDIVRTVHLYGDLSTEQREQLLKIANACPMHKLLVGEVRIQTGLAA